MPTTTISAGLSWAAYIATAIGLLGILMQPINQVETSTQDEAVRSCIEGVARVIDSLEPGISVDFPLQCATDEPLTMAGHSLSIKASNSTVTAWSRWSLPRETLESGHYYRLALSGGFVSVSRIG